VVRESPNDPGYRDQLAVALFWFGYYVRQDRPQEAETALRRAWTIEEKLVTDFPSVPDYKLRLAACRAFLALVLKASGRANDALAMFGEAFPVFEQLVADFPDSAAYWWELNEIYWRLQDMLLEDGRFQEAEKACRDCLAIMQKAPGNIRSVPRYRLVLGLNHHRLGEVLCEARRPQQAEKAYRQAMAIWAELAAAYPTNDEYRIWLANGHNNLAELYTTSPDEKYWNPAKAVQHARKAVELHPLPGGCWNTLGIVYYRTGDWQAAVHALEKSVELRKGGDCYDWFFLAMAHWRLGEKEEAHKWFDQGVQWMEKNAPQNEELRRFRGEAEQLLGVNKKKM